MVCSKAILLLGAGIMQVPLMFAIKKHGYTVIACDMNAQAVGQAYCDLFWNIDISDAEAIIQKISHAPYTIHAVVTTATDFSYVVAKVAKHCNLFGLSPQVAKNFVFKDTMRTVLWDAGVSVPQFTILNEAAIKSKSYVENANDLGYPIVIKPIHNMGARGVQKVYSDKQIHEAIDHALMFSKEKNSLIMEKNLEGPELSIDALLYNGTLYMLGIADRHVYFSPYCIELGHSIPSALPKEMVEASCQEVKKAVLALGMKEGICKADVIFHKGKPYIGELAARLSGGYMSGWTSPHYFRTNITHLAVSLALKKPIPIQAIEKIHTQSFASNTIDSALIESTGERALMGLPGKITAIRATPDISACMRKSNTFSQHYFYTYHHKKYYYCPDQCNYQQCNYHRGKVFAVYVHNRVGATSCLPKNNTHRIASILIKAQDTASIHHIAAHTISDIFVDVEINEEANMFLYSLQHEYQKSTWRCFPLDTISQQLEQDNTIATRESVYDNKHMLHFLHTALQETALPLTIAHKTSFVAYAKQQFGTWTFCSLYDALQIAIEKNLLSIHYAPSTTLSKEAQVFQQCIWRSFLRAGWQGLYYTRKLIQQCPQEIISYL